MSFLELNNVTKIYPNGTKAINETSLNIEHGELIVFVGPSGCGKSTLLRMIAGLEDITDGEIHLDEKIINKVIQKKFALLSSYYFSFISNWLIRAYKRYNDIDKFLIIIYLIHKNLIFYRKNALVIDYETFYKERTLEIFYILVVFTKGET